MHGRSHFPLCTASRSRGAYNLYCWLCCLLPVIAFSQLLSHSLVHTPHTARAIYLHRVLVFVLLCATATAIRLVHRHSWPNWKLYGAIWQIIIYKIRVYWKLDAISLPSTHISFVLCKIGLAKATDHVFGHFRSFFCLYVLSKTKKRKNRKKKQIYKLCIIQYVICTEVVWADPASLKACQASTSSEFLRVMYDKPCFRIPSVSQYATTSPSEVVNFDLFFFLLFFLVDYKRDLFLGHPMISCNEPCAHINYNIHIHIYCIYVELAVLSLRESLSPEIGRFRKNSLSDPHLSLQSTIYSHISFFLLFSLVVLFVAKKRAPTVSSSSPYSRAGGGLANIFRRIQKINYVAHCCSLARSGFSDIHTSSKWNRAKRQWARVLKWRVLKESHATDKRTKRCIYKWASAFID